MSNESEGNKCIWLSPKGGEYPFGDAIQETFWSKVYKHGEIIIFIISTVSAFSMQIFFDTTVIVMLRKVFASEAVKSYEYNFFLKMFSTLIISAVIPVLVYCVKSVVVRSKNQKKEKFHRNCFFHSMFHHIRNYTFKGLNKLESFIEKHDDTTDENIRKEYLELLLSISEYSIEICTKIREFYSVYLNMEVECCFRLAYKNGNYATIGRSKNLKARFELEDHIELNEDTGIPKAMYHNNLSKFVIIRSIDDAISDGIWQESTHDNLGDIRSMIVLPVNFKRRIVDKTSMLGILYITSNLENSKCPFDEDHAEVGCVIADALAVSYKRVVDLLNEAYSITQK